MAGNFFVVSPAVVNGNLASSFDSLSFEIGPFERAQAVITVTAASSLNGVLTPQFSLDGTTWINSATTFTLTANGSNAFTHSPVTYRYLRFSWVSTAGSGTLNVKIGTVNPAR
jgi:hypothetical protein